MFMERVVKQFKYTWSLPTAVEGDAGIVRGVSVAVALQRGSPRWRPKGLVQG